MHAITFAHPGYRMGGRQAHWLTSEPVRDEELEAIEAERLVLCQRQAPRWRNCRQWGKSAAISWTDLGHSLLLLMKERSTRAA